MRKARDVSYRRKFDLKQVEKAQNKRQWILLGVVLSLLACLAVAGTTAVVTKHYMLLSAVVLVGGLLPMFFVFEYRRPQAREIVTLAIMTALCVGVNELCSHTIPLHAGTAFVILTGTCLGPEAGFVIGLAVMAFITVFVVYGGIMNFAAWLMDHAMSPQNSALTKEELLMVYAAGVPYDLTHAGTTALCILLFGHTVIEKLQRIQIKYGIYKRTPWR